MTLLLSLPVKCNVNWRHYPVFAFFALILRSIRKCSGMRCRPVLGTIARLSRQFNVPPPVAALAANASIPRFGMVPENFLPTDGFEAGYLAFYHQVTATGRRRGLHAILSVTWCNTGQKSGRPCSGSGLLQRDGYCELDNHTSFGWIAAGRL